MPKCWFCDSTIKPTDIYCPYCHSITKLKRVYRCESCGYETTKPYDRCPACDSEHIVYLG